MITKNFIRNSIIYTIAGSLPMASAVILLPFYLHYLPVEEYGAMAVYTTFSMLVQVLITYSFDTSVYIHYHDYKNEHAKLSQFISSAFVLMAIISVIVSLFAVGGGSLLFDKLLDNKSVSFYPYGLLSVATSIFQSFFKVNSSLLQTQQKPTLYLWSNLLSFSLIAAFTIGGLIFFPNTLIGPIGGRMLAAMISGVWALMRIFKEFGVHFNFPLLKESFAFNNSSFIYQVQQWLINNFDRFVITYYLTLKDVGAYDFAFKCMLLIDPIMSGLYNSFYPKVIGLLKEQPAEVKESTGPINRYFHGYIAITMILVAISIFFFPVLIDTGIIRSGYADSWKYIPYIGILYLIRSIRTYFAFPYGPLKIVYVWPYLIIAIIKIALMISLIRILDVYAVIFSAAISAVLEIIFLRVAIKDRVMFRFNSLKIIIAPVVLIVFIFVLEPTVNINQYLRHGLFVVLTLAVLWTLYGKEVKALSPFDFLKRKI
ncbi:MAG: oligosaccharide flippase family protein [Cyclobacteriaceae bacterium]